MLNDRIIVYLFVVPTSIEIKKKNKSHDISFVSLHCIVNYVNLVFKQYLNDICPLNFTPNIRIENKTHR